MKKKKYSKSCLETIEVTRMYKIFTQTNEKRNWLYIRSVVRLKNIVGAMSQKRDGLHQDDIG